MFKTIQILFFCAVSTILLNCSRKVDTNSSVTLSFPNLNQVGSMTCATCLKSIIVKVEGDGFEKIVNKLSVEDIRSKTGEVSGEITFNIPPGLNRKFKAVAIYILNDKHVLAAGESSVNIVDTEFKEVSITMQNMGEIHGGSLVGRYITGQLSDGTTDTGPTGDVDVILNYNSDPDFDMLIQKVPILNGWFDFMASENLSMTYIIADQNLVLFQNVSLNSLVPLTLTAGTIRQQNSGRIVRPAQHQRYDGSSWTPENEKHDIVYGFFSPADSNLSSNKFVCFENSSTPSTFTKLRALDNSALTYTTGSINGIYALGGLTTADTTNCPSLATADRYAENKIYISINQLDGNGNDTAKGFGNAFTYISKDTDAGYDVRKYDTINTEQKFIMKTLPGLFSTSASAIFNNIQLFKKANATNGGFDDLQCTEDWMRLNGFTQVGISSLLSGDNSIAFSITADSSILSSDGTITCPTKLVNGTQKLQRDGGFYLGSLVMPPVNSISISGFFTDILNVNLSHGIISNPITISGVTTPVTISISGDVSATYSIDGGTSWISTSSTISANTSVIIRLVSASTVSTIRTAILTVAGISQDWNVTTINDPCSTSPTPGIMCTGGAIFLGSLSPGATSGSGIDRYMTTPSGCDDIPTGSISGGTSSTSYSNSDFTPTCTGTDDIFKTWNNGTSNYDNISSLEDQPGTAGTSSGSINTDLYYGAYNTTQIVNITDLTKGGIHAAARYCDKLSYGSYTDWYLPNRYELNLMFLNKSLIPGLNLLGNFYWSSTEKDSQYVWTQKFDTGDQIFADKNSTGLVRCVRRF